MEQAKAQEVILKKAIEGPATGDEQKEKERRALIKAGEISMLIPSLTSSELQGARKATKSSRPRFYCA